MKNNRGRSTTGDASAPYYRSTPKKEAAKYLRLVASRFINDRANESEVASAYEMFRSENTDESAR